MFISYSSRQIIHHSAIVFNICEWGIYSVDTPFCNPHNLICKKKIKLKNKSKIKNEKSKKEKKRNKKEQNIMK